MGDAVQTGLGDMFGGGGGGGASGGISYPPPTTTGATDALTGMGDYPATPDVYAGTSQVMPPSSYAPGGGAPGTGGMDFAKMLPALITGGTGLIGYLRNQGGAGDKALKAQQQATAPLQAAGNQALGAYTSGQLTPQQQAAIDLWKKQQLAMWRSELARQGIPESSAMADIEADINLKALAKGQEMIQQDFNNAFQATGLATTNLTNIARQQALQDAEQRKAWQEFMKEMGQLGTDVAGIFS